MTDLTLADALIREVADASPEETVRKVKTVAAKELEQLDPTATIHFTEYFNHTYTPDMVLRWPKTGSDERYVYLRLTDDAQELADDITRVSDHKPMLVTLSPPRTKESSAPVDTEAGLDGQAKQADTLLSDFGGLDAVGVARANTPVAQLLGATLSRGGRGLMTPERASAAIETVNAGFNGARGGDPETVGRAADVADQLLRPEQAGRVTRFFQAIWLGNGGRSDEYPRTLELGGQLDDESWAFLLGLADIDDMGFWRSVGRGLTLLQVSRLQQPPGRNLHYLVKANCQTIWARACRTLARDQTLFDSDEPDSTWQWIVERSVLALRGPRLVAYLGENKEALSHLDTEESDGVAIPELRRRATGVLITKVVGRVGSEELDLANIDHQDVTSSQVLDLLAKTPGAELKVTKATALTESRHSLSLDFTTSSATAVTRSKPGLRSLVAGALPLLRAMSDSDVEGMTDAFDPHDDQDLLSFLDEEADQSAGDSLDADTEGDPAGDTAE